MHAVAHELAEREPRFAAVIARFGTGWPAGDLALAVAIADLWSLPAPPAPLETIRRAEAWRPWRAVATRLLRHQYLNARRASRIK